MGSRWGIVSSGMKNWSHCSRTINVVVLCEKGCCRERQGAERSGRAVASGCVAPRAWCRVAARYEKNEKGNTSRIWWLVLMVDKTGCEKVSEIKSGGPSSGDGEYYHTYFHHRKKELSLNQIIRITNIFIYWRVASISPRVFKMYTIEHSFWKYSLGLSHPKGFRFPYLPGCPCSGSFCVL